MPPLIYWISLSICLGASLFALLKGDTPERMGALLRIGVAFLGVPLVAALRAAHLPHNQVSALADLTETAAMSFGLLFIAIRYASNWLALAMVIQGLEFYIDRVLMDADVNVSSFAFQEDVITAGVSLVLAFATLASMRRRHHQRLADAARRQKDEARMARIEALISGPDAATA